MFSCKLFNSGTKDGQVQNGTIEERVAILEFQVDNINSDLSDLEQNLVVVEDEQEAQGQEIAELKLETNSKRGQVNQNPLKLVCGSQYKE